MNRDGAEGEQSTGEPVQRSAAASGGQARYVVIVGVGLSGRTTANTVEDHGIDYAVIETNPDTVSRCTKGGLKIILGDARDPEVLRQALIERATDIAVTVPSDQITLGGWKLPAAGRTTSSSPSRSSRRSSAR